VKLSQIPRAPEDETAETIDSSALVSEALDGSRVAITIFDSDLKLLYANQHVNYLFGSMPPRATLIGARATKT